MIVYDLLPKSPFPICCFCNKKNPDTIQHIEWSTDASRLVTLTQTVSMTWGVRQASLPPINGVSEITQRLSWGVVKSRPNPRVSIWKYHYFKCSAWLYPNGIQYFLEEILQVWRQNNIQQFFLTKPNRIYSQLTVLCVLINSLHQNTIFLASRTWNDIFANSL